MPQKFLHRFLWVLLIFPLSLTLVVTPDTLHAQEGGNNFKEYDASELGIKFEIPTHWEVWHAPNRLMMGAPEDVAAQQNFEEPVGLVIVINLGTYNTMGIQNADQVQSQLGDFVPTGATASASSPVTYGNSSGYSLEFTIPDTTLSTRVALLSIVGARLAVVRAYAPQDYWTTTGNELFTNIMATIDFYLPEHLANPLANVPDEDGGVLWHYQSSQPLDAPIVNLGGLTIDDYGVVYVAAGERGFLAVNQADGSFVNYLGPLFDDDNLYDVAIGPQDQLLYFANGTPGLNNQIMVTDRVGNYVRGWGSAGDGAGQFAPNMPQTIAVTRRGDVWVVSEGHAIAPTNRLYRFDRYGNLLAAVDLADVNSSLSRIRLDNNIETDGLFLIGETGGLNILDSDGSLLVPNIDKDFLTESGARDIAIGPEGLIVIATENEGFLLFTNLGELIDRFGWKYDAEAGGRFQPGEFSQVAGIVIDPSSNVYFAETNRASEFSQIQAFSFSGSGVLDLPQRPNTADTDAGVVITSSGGQIQYGMTVRGLIDNRSPVHEYRIDVLAGDTVVIQMKDISADGVLDPTLVLLDINYNEIVRNDDGGATLPEGFSEDDSQIRFTPNANATLIIQATRFGGTGEYELTVTNDNPRPTETPASTPTEPETTPE